MVCTNKMDKKHLHHYINESATHHNHRTIETENNINQCG